ncbi:MAG: SGNH/GDSL hydrolase family protein [Lachnospiraceae bacterium]|nr:SGNH/GDSL hydrolase family protein [Lachnospiraceae bacterium]
MENRASKKFIRQFFTAGIVLLLLCILTVVVFDPFFQYHKPLKGLKAVLTDKEYQCVGSLKTFDYDSVIAGSSVSENYYNDWFNQGFGCNSIKAIRSYGATADLCYLLDIAFSRQDLKYVFYNLDSAALVAEPETTYELTGCPMYLYDDNYINDVEYWLNKGVLMEKIPYLIANSTIGGYDENDSYNWAQWKQFNSDMILGLYIRKPSIAEMKPADYYEEILRKNIALLTERIGAHPETEFYVFIPPYSMLWWDNIYREGDMEAYLYNMEQAMEALLSFENVKLFYFQNDREIITNLENYMDIIHFSPEINRYICECLINGKNQVSKDNYREIICEMRELSYEIVEKLVKPYEDRIKVDIYDE